VKNAARVIDFRLRPPSRGFLGTIMYANVERTQRLTAGIGMTQPPSVAKRSVGRSNSDAKRCATSAPAAGPSSAVRATQSADRSTTAASFAAPPTMLARSRGCGWRK
jgi:hypothetical protein